MCQQYSGTGHPRVQRCRPCRASVSVPVHPCQCIPRRRRSHRGGLPLGQALGAEEPSPQPALLLQGGGERLHRSRSPIRERGRPVLDQPQLASNRGNEPSGRSRIRRAFQDTSHARTRTAALPRLLRLRSSACVGIVLGRTSTQALRNIPEESQTRGRVLRATHRVGGTVQLDRIMCRLSRESLELCAVGSDPTTGMVGRGPRTPCFALDANRRGIPPGECLGMGPRGRIAP